MPGSELDSGETAAGERDDDPCPHGARGPTGQTANERSFPARNFQQRAESYMVEMKGLTCGMVWAPSFTGGVTWASHWISVSR